MRSPAAATCSFGCRNGMPANGQAVLCVDPIVIHAKPFQLIPNQNWSIGKLCTVDPIVMFIQAPMFGYLYQNPLTIYLAFNFGNTFKIPFITCFLSKGAVSGYSSLHSGQVDT